MRRQAFINTVAAALLIGALSAQAAVPNTLNYQGFLTDATTGQPQNATVGVTFKLYDALTGGNLLYTETQSVTPSNGTFNVQIGSFTAFPATLVFDKPYWLEITVGAQILTPRQPLASSATALRAKVAESISPAPGTGIRNFAVGNGALTSNTTGFNNTATGDSSLTSNTTGFNNSASGTSALFSNTTGRWNTANGAAALYYNTIGIQNTASGSGALYNNTTGSTNTATGFQALFINNTGYSNTASGSSALAANTTGYSNTADGSGALISNTTGYGNTGNGQSALYYTTTGFSNTASGTNALAYNTTGANNIAIGNQAGYSLTTGNYNIDIGNQGVAAEGNTIRIGDGNQSRAFIAGAYNTTPANATPYPVVIDSAGQLGSALTLQVPGNNNWDLNSNEGDFRIGNATYRLKIGVPIDGGGAGDVAIKADGGLSRLSLIAAGGTAVYSNTNRTAGVFLGSGSGSWASISDRAAKHDIVPLNASAILAKVAEMPVYAWRYNSEGSGARHVGPMAQDFRAAFGLGDSDKTITSVDADGIALAAIKGLYEKLLEKDEEIAQLKTRTKRLDFLERELAAIKAKLGLK